jgi:hypothetical protein
MGRKRVKGGGLQDGSADLCKSTDMHICRCRERKIYPYVRSARISISIRTGTDRNTARLSTKCPRVPHSDIVGKSVIPGVSNCTVFDRFSDPKL